ncbi:hypothetical protein LTR84_010652 [Exophiala bonariae]|uniref:Ketoreductase (KR) domain-containing protein n=1 Tax=Exophiala bonariae TaxID=1690606 RepID=A0AAV9MUI0_9EURO|nr:hypothetical protein LTR84_010652 [Exophiala bonariae]
MVSYREIQASNELISDANAPRVAVFVGGTSGIGQLTVKALVNTGVSIRIYLVGRKSSEERIQTLIDELQAINPQAEVIWTEGEISLLSETKRICEVIKAKESRVDLLFLTAGYIPFGERKETTEGLETVQSLEYYSRMLFTTLLFPLLGLSENPRVVSVLSGGLERVTSINLDDLDLKKPGNFGGVAAQGQYGTMNSIYLDKLATNHTDITFIHSWPGAVNTGSVRRGFGPNSIMVWVIRLLLEPLLALVSYSDNESAQRHLFQSTSAAFGGRGIPWKGKPGVNSREQETTGLFLVNHKCDCTPNTRVIPVLREKAQTKVWDHTQEVLRPYL